MTYPDACPAAHGTAGFPAAGAAHAPAPPPPGAGPGRLIPIHGAEFSADPRATYERLRALGPIAPVEIAPGVPGYLTTTYRAALHLLRNTPQVFAKDPHHWEDLNAGRIPPDSPVLTMMSPRDDHALSLDGEAHARLRGSVTDALELVDTHQLVDTVVRVADQLIDGFAERGRADLVTELTGPLPMHVLVEMFGSPPDLGRRIVRAVTKLFDTSQDAAEANGELETACLELTRQKRREPGADVTSWLVGHKAQLSDPEMIQQILLVIGAGTNPSTNLISNALLLMIDDDRFAGNVFDGVQPVGEVLEHVLWEDSPVANYCPLYARRPEVFEGVALRPGVPILISFAAANSDPAVATSRALRLGNRAHLAFSAGVRRCPAPGLARVIAESAVERTLDRLPDLALSCPRERLVRRPGTFQSGWASLPVEFTPVALSSTFVSSGLSSPFARYPPPPGMYGKAGEDVPSAQRS